MNRTKTTVAAPAKRAAIYLRVSVETEQKQNAKERAGRSTNADYSSLDAQRDRTLAYIASQPGWRYVTQYVDDGRSGKDLNRTEVQRMFDDIEAGKIDAVVVYKIDRLSRSLRDFVAVMERFDKLGVTFASVTQNFQTDTPVGRLTLNILASFAEFEREMIVERTRDKIAATRAQGMWSGGQPPLGYDLKDGALIVNDSEAETVRAIFTRYLTTRSVRDVAQSLNAEKRAIKQRGKQARAWTPNMVSRVLRNAVTTGVITHGETVYQGRHAAIVDHDTFKAAQAMLDANTIEGERAGRNPEYVLQGIIRCTCGTPAGRVCDSAMAPGNSGNSKGAYRYYRCVGREKGRDGCKSRALPASAIESFVVERLRNIAAGGAVAANVTAHARELVTKHRPAIAARVETLSKRASELAESSARLVESMASANDRTRAKLAERAERAQAELAACESELATARKHVDAIDAAQAESAWLSDQLGSFDAVWDLLEPENRGRLLRGLVRTVNVDEPAHKIEIVFAPLDETRRAILAGQDDRDPFVSVVSGELYRERATRAIGFTGNAPPPPKPRVSRPAKVARLLALAHHVDAAIASGACDDLATMAARLKFTRARVTQLMDLTMLAPDIQEQILNMVAIDGREPLRERTLRPVMAHMQWDRQRAEWARLMGARNAGAERAPRNPHKRGKGA
jgi:DNA invertase Pin-like site-specific DNA recombinase